MMTVCVLFLLVLSVSLIQCEQVQRVQECRARCPQGLACKSKPYVSFGTCRKPPESMSVPIIHQVNVSTAMMCESKHKCSLYLRVRSIIHITEHIQGVTLCTMSPGMLQRCRAISFNRETRDRHVGQQVEVEHDCWQVNAGHHLYVEMQTIPSYCQLGRSQHYHVPQCMNQELRNNVPECITGTLAYSVDTERKTVSVNVSHMLEDKDYHLRLCHKGFICKGTGAHRLVSRDSAVKQATLHYSTPLPCLCIEGWSHMSDAPRVQICPFTNNTEELWSGVTFDPEQEVLFWQTECPVKVTATLCHMEEQSKCLDLAGSAQEVNVGKGARWQVDPHPRVCVKFSLDQRFWIKCPFEGSNLPAWHLRIDSSPEGSHTKLSSKTSVKLNVSVCERSQKQLVCKHITAVPLEKSKSVDMNMSSRLCSHNICMQVQRVDVKFSVPVLQCDLHCLDQRADWEADWLLLVGVCLTAVFFVVLMGSIAFTVYWRKQMMKRRAHLYQSTADVEPCDLQPACVLGQTLDAMQIHDLEQARDLGTLLSSLALPVQPGRVNLLLWSKNGVRLLERMMRSKTEKPPQSVSR